MHTKSLFQMNALKSRTSSGLSCGDRERRVDLRLRVPFLSQGLLSFWPNSSSREWRSMGNSSSPVVAPLHTFFLPSTFSLGMRSQFSFLSRLRRTVSVRLNGEHSVDGGGGGGGGVGGGGGGGASEDGRVATSAGCESMAVTSTAGAALTGGPGCLPCKAPDCLKATLRLMCIEEV